MSDYKINLEIVKGDELEIFSKFNKKDKLSVYWNKIYEPDIIAKGKKIRDLFIKNEINYKSVSYTHLTLPTSFLV